MDLVIQELIIEEDRPEHIAKHNIEINEVLEVVEGDLSIFRENMTAWS